MLKERAKEMHNKAQKMADSKIKKLPEFSPDTMKEMFHELEVHQIELEMQNEELLKIYAKLSEAKNRYFELYNMAPVCYCTLNYSGLITEANLRTLQTIGLEREQLIMRPISDFIYKEDQDIFYINQRKMQNTPEPRSCELRIVIKNGLIAWMHISATQDKDSEGNVIYRLVLSDISEQKRVEEELKDKDKMMIIQSRYAAMGEMISMIAHQWRQPLNIIGLATANMQTKQALHMLDETSIDDNTTIIAENIAFMSDTIDDFRNFFKPDAPKELTTAEDVIAIALKVIGQSLTSSNIEVKIHNQSKTALLIHKNSLVQVLLNLLGNAKDALLSNDIESALINITVNETEEQIAISICDNAGGIPQEIIDKINQPYFTTKKLNGTGLGLYISQTIIEKHFFGTLTWYNKMDGACFVMTLNKQEKEGGELDDVKTVPHAKKFGMWN